MTADPRTPADDPASLMVIAAARQIADREVCFVGVGQPSEVAMVAVRCHAPGACLVYESGCIGSAPSTPPLSVADEDLVRSAQSVVSVPEIFNYWLQGGFVDLGIVGAAQVDRFGNINSTVIGDYDAPRVRLPGAGGAPTIAGFAKRTIVVTRHVTSALVDGVDFVTTAGQPEDTDRSALGLTGPGVTAVVTDKAVLRLDPESRELVLTQHHPGVGVDDILANTGWPLRVAAHVEETAAATDAERAAVTAVLGTAADPR